MASGMIEVCINGQKITCQPGERLIDVADRHGIYIPRFCYHKKLSVVANCRMCLVEVEKVPKPLPACATQVNEGMVVHTRSKLSRQAQKAVMEFLLINHPLDCPVCDQGGECELQDVAMGYGQSVSQYNQGKRAVEDEDLGPLIATHMTRCIHCTRCVRFGREIAGMAELGACGRGENMSIGTYLQSGMHSEVSGNVIDLCPVGALTTKPARFNGRSWHYSQHASVAPHDCWGSNLFVHTCDKHIGQQSEIMRVLPRENEAINQTWLSDRDRFSYLGLGVERLTEPMLKEDGLWRQVSWDEALGHVQQMMQNMAAQAEEAALLLSPSSSCEEAYLAQRFWRQWGGHHVDHRLRLADVQDQADWPSMLTMPHALQALQKAPSVVLFGAALRQHVPLLNLRVRQAVLAGVHAHRIHAWAEPLNYPLSSDHCQHVAHWPGLLAGLAKQAGVKWPKGWPKVEAIKLEGLSLEKGQLWLLGESIWSHPQGALLRSMLRHLQAKVGIEVLMLTEGSNSAGCWLAGAVGHRNLFGPSSEEARSAAQCFTQPMPFYWLHQIEPEHDALHARQALSALKQAVTVQVSSFVSSQALQYADVLLPCADFMEAPGTTINVMGHVQQVRAAKMPMGQARPAWKIYRMLATLLEQDDMAFDSVDQVWQRLEANLHLQEDSPAALTVPIAVAMPEGLVRLGYPAAMSVDAIVRRSLPLNERQGPWQLCMHPKTAKACGLAETAGEAFVAQGGVKLRVKLRLDSDVAEGCLLLPGAVPEAMDLGGLMANMIVEPVHAE